MEQRVLIIGACGQIGTELTLKLRDKYGTSNVVASDLKEGTPQLMTSGLFIKIDATDKEQIRNILVEFNITQVYMMAAMLSATAEKMPLRAWDLNMTALLTILELGKEGLYKQLFWPSSIGAFGPNSPHTNTPQDTIMAPTTVYGISKLAGERWCAYYNQKYGVDIRGLRYPGLIGHRSAPGGGTTDYAVDIFHKAVNGEKFISFLEAETRLPMMYMEDAIRATIEITEAPKSSIKIHDAYNLAGIDFTPNELFKAIKLRMPRFEMSVDPDFRQSIAESWPSSINDNDARTDWGWQPRIDLDLLVDTMLDALSKKKSESETLEA